MNKIISIIMLVIMIAAGLESYHLFRSFEYNASALLTITAYLSIVTSIYFLTKGRATANYNNPLLTKY